MDLRNKYLLKFFLIILILSLFVFYIYPVSADDKYYADVNIEVDSSGFVTIEGFTNHPELLVKNTELYTLKKQSYWLLNITKEEVFSDFVYVLSLPDDSSINYVTASGSFRIETSNDKLLVKGFGENESFSVVVQYQLEKTAESDNILESNLLFIFLIPIIILVVIIVILFFRKSKYIKKSQEPSLSVEVYNSKGLNQRQKDIMKLLIERKIALTQTDIQKELKIPKAAVSRNIRGLELRGLIEKEQSGMSNLIRLKKP